jgi:hypothetical protein
MDVHDEVILADMVDETRQFSNHPFLPDIVRICAMQDAASHRFPQAGRLVFPHPAIRKKPRYARQVA